MRRFIVIFFICLFFISLSFYVGYVFSNFNNSNSQKFINDKLPDRMTENNILVSSDKLTLFGEFVISSFYDTKSMFPIADVNSNGIYLKASENDQFFIGDIVSFERENKSITHRIVAENYDVDGTYYTTKGDNSPVDDPYKIRKKDIKRIMVGVLW